MKRYMMLALLFVAIAVAQVAVTALCKYLQQKDGMIILSLFK